MMLFSSDCESVLFITFPSIIIKTWSQCCIHSYTGGVLTHCSNRLLLQSNRLLLQRTACSACVNLVLMKWHHRLRQCSDWLRRSGFTESPQDSVLWLAAAGASSRVHAAVVMKVQRKTFLWWFNGRAVFKGLFQFMRACRVSERSDWLYEVALTQPEH